jgi:hypothetical protein
MLEMTRESRKVFYTPTLVEYLMSRKEDFWSCRWNVETMQETW